MDHTLLGDSPRAQRFVHRAMRRLHLPPVSVFYHQEYRPPIATFEAVSGAEPRRSDFVAWFLVDCGLLVEAELQRPERISYRDLGRVHTAKMLDALSDPKTLARVYAVTPGELRPEVVVRCARLVCGGTLAAAREALRTRRATLNLEGGFHHASPGRSAGFCLVNDIAVAIATVRAAGFTGQVAVLDLDAHPPDGTAACLEQDPKAWIGSISGTSWGELPRVDEVVLRHGDDQDYLVALDELLDRMPRPDLAFVLAGGDVLCGDRHGGLCLTPQGARSRDERVRRVLEGIGSVWLPAGGYHPDAWRLLAGTALVLGRSPVPRVPREYDAMDRHFSHIARHITRDELSDEGSLSLDDVAGDLRMGTASRPRLLDFYTADGLEYAFERFGVLDHLRRLGYGRFSTVVDGGANGDRVRVYGNASGRTHLLIELAVERRRIDDKPVLFVHWLTLRNPLAPFDPTRPRLPGQEVPGLGLAREFSTLLGRMAKRVELSGVAFAPSHFHMAYAARAHARFVSPERQGRFEALCRDVATLPLAKATCSVAEGQVTCNGEPYAWEATEMVFWLEPTEWDEESAAKERERCEFVVEGGRG